MIRDVLVLNDRPDRSAYLSNALDARRQEGLLRTLQHHRHEVPGPHILRGGKRFLNFSSNDYLGLAMDPAVRERASLYAELHGGGAEASRLVTGGLEIHARLEERLAALTRRESALLFVSGYQANVTILPALVGRSGLLVCDRLCHNSLLQGARLSQGKLLRFRHNDPGHLDEVLSSSAAGTASPVLVVTESIFSMDGDRAPLDEIAAVADAHNAFLMVDDAHALGVWGDRGEGLAAAHPRVDLLLGTFGKALGSSGAFVAGSELLRSYLVNFCGGVIYSTAPAPATVGAAEAALDRIGSGELDLPGYHRFIEQAHALLRASGFDTSPSSSQILPIRLGGEEEALACAEYLAERGILAVAIRPPTVPPGTSRLRLSITRHHGEEDLETLVAALVEWRARGAR